MITNTLNLGGDPIDPEELEELKSADRGNDVPSLEDTLYAAQEPPNPAETEPEDPAAAPEDPAAAPEDPAAAPEDPPKEPESAPKDHRIPKSRFDEVNNERKAALARVAQLEARNKAFEATSEVNFDDLEDQYAEALLDGDKDRAKNIRATIRQAEQAAILSSTQNIAHAAKDLTRNEMEFDLAVQVIEADYEPFDRNSEHYDQNLVDEALELFEGFVNKGLAPAAAMKKATNYVVSANGVAKRSAPAKAAAPRPSSVAAKLEAATRQPPNQQGKGGGTSEPNYAAMTDDEFAALPKATLARLRGDIM